jgi:FKBP-type peptidyl-prolyl cis-trans isomerase FkpA
MISPASSASTARRTFRGSGYIALSSMIIYRKGGKDGTTPRMTKPALFFVVLALAVPACNQGGGGGGGSVKLDTDDQKTLYALGLILGRNVAGFNLSASELDTVKAGMTDAALGKKPKVELEQYGPRVNQLRNKRMSAKADDEKKKGKAFEDKAAQEQGAERTASGMVFKSLGGGSGESPKASDTVKVNYKGTLTDGTEFDSSYKRGQPAEFPLMGVIPCWTEGVQKMKVGEKAKLVCPSNIAYGDQGRPPTIPGGATLVFEVELVGITTNAQPAMPGMPQMSAPAPGGPQPTIPGAHPTTAPSGTKATPPTKK